jgi:hypothetical protein
MTVDLLRFSIEAKMRPKCPSKQQVPCSSQGGVAI